MTTTLNQYSLTFGSSTLTVNSGSSLPGRVCRVWGKKANGFDGEGNGIRASANLSSFTQLSTGRWRCVYATALPTANHSSIGLAYRNNSDAFISADHFDRTNSYSTFVLNNYYGNDRFDFGLDFAAFY